jgi:hypothetical protein
MASPRDTSCTTNRGRLKLMGDEVQGQYGGLNFHAKRGGQGAKLTVAVKNKWAEAWTRALFNCKVLLLRSPSPVRGKVIYTQHSYMAALDFAMEPSFECSDDDATDVAFVKATHSIGGQDTVEEYMACRLFPLLASFSLGEVSDGAAPDSRLSLPLLEFPVAKVMDETDDRFHMRVELAAENIMGRYDRGEHDVCLAVVPNECRLNQVFMQASVSYGPRLELGSEASKEAARKGKDAAGAGPAGKRVKVPSQKATAPKGIGAASLKAAPMSAKSTGAALSKAAL